MHHNNDVLDFYSFWIKIDAKNMLIYKLLKKKELKWKK